MRVVLDTNVIVSGLNFRGREREALDLAYTGRYTLVLSPFILAEVEDVLTRKFAWDARSAQTVVALLRRAATVVDPKPTLSVVAHDADNRILECAAAARADFLVTGDRRHLLPLREHRGTRIVTTAQFLSALADAQDPDPGGPPDALRNGAEAT